jgi:polyphosphate kinase
MRPAFRTLIQREMEIQRNGGQGRIIAKMNAIDDVELIQALYEASRAGVSIDLIVRGHTRLRPGLPGISENIRLRSIIGRFLEHDRAFMFGNDGQARVFIGSADWRWRNLEGRVEAVVEVMQPDIIERIRGILQAAIDDNTLAWELGESGQYNRCQPADGEPARSFQTAMMADARSRRAASDERVTG